MQKIDINKLDELSLDLRISLLHCCFQQSNYSRIIKELPLKFCYSQKKNAPNFNALKIAVKQFPSINNIKKEWIKLNDESRALIEWFMTSTPMKHTQSLNFLPSPDLHEVLDCKHQFEIIRKPNNKFIETKEKYGSVIAYHGSPTQNWHAIIEHNLQNLSYSKSMTGGALFGSGIYLTSAISLSRSFSSMSKTWNKSKIGSHLQCVGVFEIALHPDSVKRHFDETNNKNKNNKKNKMNVPKHYYVVQDNTYIHMKGMLVWKQTKKQTENKTKMGYWMILFYAILLLALIAYQVKWDRVRKQTFRYVNNFMK